MATVNPAKYWHKLPDGKIQCDLCPRLCKLANEQSGFCTYRKREGSEISSLLYGFASGFCIDPIEKKPLFHFLPGSPTLSFGTLGCNLGCKFCQNWDVSRCQVKDAVVELVPPHEIARAARKMGCSSVAFTYNEPVVFHEYAVATAKECHKLGIRTVAVTAGYVSPEPREEFYSHMDAVNVDLKAFTDSFYREYTNAELQPVLETLEYIRKQTFTWLEITTLLIPGLNDSPHELEAMSKWIVETLGPEVPLHLTAFFPSYKMSDHPYMSPELLRRARKIVLRSGLRYVYTGNIRDPKSESTYCHSCKKILIGRNDYNFTDWNLSEEGACKNCGTVCPGVFEAKPGTWGSKRTQIKLAARGYIPTALQ